jgi:N6-adenosine-specific RNA methylase IME4
VSAIQTGEFAGLEQNGYGCILADPAWSWVSFAGKGSAPHRTDDEPYKTMTIDEMRALPVADLAAPDCVLIMWVIGSHLDQAIELGRHWGFTYKTDVFTWVKTGKNDPAVRPISMGKWSRKQTEQALLFSRGKPSRLEAGVRQLFESDEHVIFAPKREHSRKPDEQYDRIERLCGGPYVELFARQSRFDWDSWGNETTKFDPAALAQVDEFSALL